MGENKMKIGLFADSHYAEIGRIGSRLPSASYDKLLEAIEAFKTAGVRFIFCLGDLLQATDDPETDRKAAEKIMQPLRDCGIPVYYIWGNHDSEAMPADNLCRIACALSAPACVSYEGRTLVLLDLNYKRDGTPYQAGENDWTNTAMPDDEYDWLKSILRAADGEVVIFTHQNLWGGEGDPHVIANAAEVRALLEKYGNVSRVYSGHRHTGGEAAVNGITYSTLRAMCEEHTPPEERYRIIEV